MTKKVSKKTVTPKLPPKKAPSKTTSTKSPDTGNEKKSKVSPKKSKVVSKPLKAAYSDKELASRLKAVPLSSSGKKLKGPIKGPVIYGMEEKKPNGKTVVHKIKMDPQRYREKDLKSLETLYRQSAKAQKSTTPELAFSEVKVPGKYKKTKAGKDRYKTLKAGPLSGKKVKIFATELKFEQPTKEKEYRQLLATGTKIKRAIHKNFQKRNEYEFVKSKLLGKAGFTNFKESHSRFVAGHKIAETTLKGKTLTEALNKIQVPVSALWLDKKKVVVPKFAKDAVGNIVVTGNVKVKSGGKVENMPLNVSVRYLTDVPTTLGRAIRQKLADAGKTFTTPKELAAIAKGAWNKLKAIRGVVKTKKAKDEMRRLLVPGFDAKGAKLGSSIKKIISGESDGSFFPLATPDSVAVNLNFAFYSDPHSAKSSQPKKTGSKKGTKK